MPTEAQSRAYTKYRHSDKMKQVSIRLFQSTDGDVIKYLEEHPVRQTIIRAVRELAEREGDGRD